MKCIKNTVTGTIKRVTDVDAKKAVKEGTYVYCPKHEFKATKEKKKE
jgi:hypothetical protein